MFKRKGFITIALIATLSLLISACGGGSSSNDDSGSSNGGSGEAEYTLVYTDHDPPGAMRTKFLEEVWFPEIEKQTDGKVKIQANFGGALMSSQEALDGVGNGIADMGHIFPDFFPSKLYSYQIFRLFPNGPENWENIHQVYQQALKEIPELTQELKEHNQKPLMLLVGLPSVFGSTYEMNGLEELKGNKWRASSPWHLKTLEHVGANPVSVPWEDVYSSLSNGVIDGVLTNYDGFHQMKFYENAQHVNVAPQLWWGSPFIHTINLDTWNKLPEDVQEGIKKASEIAAGKYAKVYSDGLENTIQEEKDEGAEVSKLSDEEIQPFLDQDLLKNFRESWIKTATNEHGYEDAEGDIEKMKKIMEDALNNK